MKSYASTQSLMAELEADPHLPVHQEHNQLFAAVLALETAMAS